MEVQGKIALVTGGARRIGRVVCEELARRGACVVIHYNQSGDAAAELAGTLRARGGTAFTLEGDLTRAQSAEDIIARVITQAGGLDILVNNAAVFARREILQQSDDEIRRIFEIDFFAPLYLALAFTRARGSGCIINMLDQRITGLDTHCAAYVLAKKSLAAATRLLALACAPGVRVNAIAPGAVLPPVSADARENRNAGGAALLEAQCRPVDVARAVLFLVESDVVTGQTLFVDSGQHLGGLDSDNG